MLSSVNLAYQEDALIKLVMIWWLACTCEEDVGRKFEYSSVNYSRSLTLQHELLSSLQLDHVGSHVAIAPLRPTCHGHDTGWPHVATVLPTPIHQDTCWPHVATVSPTPIYQDTCWPHVTTVSTSPIYKNVTKDSRSGDVALPETGLVLGPRIPVNCQERNFLAKLSAFCCYTCLYPEMARVCARVLSISFWLYLV